MFTVYFFVKVGQAHSHENWKINFIYLDSHIFQKGLQVCLNHNLQF